MNEAVLFYAFGGLAVISAWLVVANPFSRNPVTSAMFLVVTIAALAGLFVVLHAFFLAAVQVLIYAGAVMVLFLFVIMLLDLRVEERRRVRMLVLIPAIVVVGTILTLFLGAVHEMPAAARGVGSGAAMTANATAATIRLDGSTTALGNILFTRYLLPFEIVSVLLLVAMVGVILLSKKQLK